MWLHKQLHAMYDEITAEPLPNDLLNLIERDADESKQPAQEEVARARLPTLRISKNGGGLATAAIPGSLPASQPGRRAANSF